MPYNPGNVRKLNALGGKRPQATGIALLPKNGNNILATSEGSVNNYGGNKKMGLYSNVGMSYKFQNSQLTGARLNGNMPYFHGHGTITKASVKSKNMITVEMLDDGDSGANNGTIGFVSAPYWGQLSRDLTSNIGLGPFLDAQHIDTAMGRVNGKKTLTVGDAKIIAIEMWRSGSLGPVDYSVAPGIHIWATNPIDFKSVTIRRGSAEVTLVPQNVYNKQNTPNTTTGAEGNRNDQVKLALDNNKFPGNYGTGTPIPLTTTVYWLPFPSTTRNVPSINASGQPFVAVVPNKPGLAARAIFPDRSVTDANSTVITNIKQAPLAVTFN
tara:strand:+ start:38 stop:1015 length:978 start_codon:yes stop_codon:yes gene_type:complete